MSGFYLVNNLIRLMCVLMIGRVWLYSKYFAVHGQTWFSQIVILIVILIAVYIIVTLKRAMKSQDLATDGLYHFVAHPAYLMYLVIDVPIWFLVPITPFLVLTGISFYTVLLMAAYSEEKLLVRRFGGRAKSYFAKTLSIHYILRVLRISSLR